jgi:prephenate dehydrogenase
MAMKVGIIGGTGRMGRFFGGVFERAGNEVLVCGRKKESSCREIAEQCSVVMVSVPIRDTVPVIRKIAPLLSKDQLICDLTSLKSGPVAAMLESKASVIGLHPMFGPSIPSLSGQTIIATPARCSPETAVSLISIFEREGAKITYSTPEEHDRIMAVVQGLTHVVTLTVAGTMRRLGTTPADTEPFMSPVYQIELGLVGRLLSQDPDLYGDILTGNPNIPMVLSACSKTMAELSALILAGDTEGFRKIFSEDARHFEGYCERAAEETDLLIRAMVGR